MMPTNVSPGEMFVFLLLAAVTVGFALHTITRTNPVTATMSLVATFVGLAGIYATLSAHFLAIMQISVYAGAIMVLFIFVVMILNRNDVTPVSLRGLFSRVLGVGAGIWLFSFVSLLALNAAKGPGGEVTGLLPAQAPPGFGTVASVGKRLFTEYVFPFEAISVLLLIAIVGGLVVSRSAKQEGQAEKVAQRQSEVRGMIRAATVQGEGGDVRPDAHGGGGHH